MKSIEFDGLNLGPSKSQCIRDLFIDSFAQGNLKFSQQSADDIVLTQKALEALKNNENTFDAQHSAALLRFLFFRVSRLKGQFKIKASSRLIKRNHNELLNIATQLGFEAKITEEAVSISSYGWQKPQDAVSLNLQDSSQFLSGLLLSSWELDFDLELKLTSEKVSFDYVSLTLEMLRARAWRGVVEGTRVFIPRAQKPDSSKTWHAEIDLSSTFAICALAAVAGKTHIYNFPKESLQADRIFLKILTDMGVRTTLKDSSLEVFQSRLSPIEVNLREAPDLFPVLAALCTVARGKSVLKGARHLRWKESNRIQKCAELLSSSAVDVKVQDDGLIIFGSDFPQGERVCSDFDCEDDHRLAMAAAVLFHAGFKRNILSSKCVSKSFPDFWRRAQLPQECLL